MDRWERQTILSNLEVPDKMKLFNGAYTYQVIEEPRIHYLKTAMYMGRLSREILNSYNTKPLDNLAAF